VAALVIDNGVFFAHILNELLAVHTRALLNSIAESGDEISAPVLLRYEQMSVLRRSVSRGVLSPGSAAISLEWLASIKINLLFDEMLAERAYALATELDLPVAYDSQYLALAERLDCDFWTTDRRLITATSATNLRVKWLGDFVANPEVNA